MRISVTTNFGNVVGSTLAERCSTTGYLCVMSRDELAEDKLESEDEQIRLSDLRLEWTPNDELNAHFSGGGEPATPGGGGDKPDFDTLPEGWDRAYDPTTGHEYRSKQHFNLQ